MVMANLTYVKPLAEAETYLEAHIAFLNNYDCAGNYIVLAGKILTLVELSDFRRRIKQRIIAEEPFYINEIVSYEALEFCPSKYAADSHSL